MKKNTIIWLGLLSCQILVAQTYHKAVDKFFNSSDPFIKGTVIPNIEKNRMGDFSITFKNVDGTPISGLTVSASLVRHEFLFGACPPKGGSENKLQPEHQKKWGEIFNYSIPQYTQKWDNVESTQGTRDFTAADRLLGFMDDNDILAEHHFLTGYHADWLSDISESKRGEFQRSFALESLERYKDRIKYFQVYNEDWKTHISRAKVYFDQTDFFSEIATKYPDLSFGINDHWEIRPGSNEPPDPSVVAARYTGIKWIGIHAHSPRGLWASPEQIYQAFSPYLNSDIKIHITEYGIIREKGIEGNVKSGTWTDDLIAEYYVQTFATAYSHPGVEAFNQWGVGPDYNRYTGNNLFLEDGSETPLYHALKSLITDKLATKANVTTSDAGAATFNGTYGRYNIVVNDGSNNPDSAVIVLKPGQTTMDLNVVALGGNLTLLLPGDPIPTSLDKNRPAQNFPAYQFQNEDILFSGVRGARLRVYNMAGKLLLKSDDLNEEFKLSLKTWAFRGSAGKVYYFKFEDALGRSYTKAIKLP